MNAIKYSLHSCVVFSPFFFFVPLHSLLCSLGLHNFENLRMTTFWCFFFSSLQFCLLYSSFARTAINKDKFCNICDTTTTTTEEEWKKRKWKSCSGKRMNERLFVNFNKVQCSWLVITHRFWGMCCVVRECMPCHRPHTEHGHFGDESFAEDGDIDNIGLANHKNSPIAVTCNFVKMLKKPFIRWQHHE